MYIEYIFYILITDMKSETGIFLKL